LVRAFAAPEPGLKQVSPHDDFVSNAPLQPRAGFMNAHDLARALTPHVANWDQLERVWAFVVGFFKFIWSLLQFLGGG
jgi:hypothetical protein